MVWCLVKHRNIFTYTLLTYLSILPCHLVKLSLCLTKHHTMKKYPSLN